MGLMSVLVLFLALFHIAYGQGRGAIILYKNGLASPSYSSGIVRIYYSSTGLSTIRWGNICDDNYFSYNEANVICRQLGYTGVSTYGKTASTSSYGTDTISTILDEVDCIYSSYLALLQCSYSSVISSSCSSNSQDAFVVCYTTRIWNNPYSGQIRLQGGSYSSYGRLEVYCNGQWGTVCDDTFDSDAAMVACRQLGYQNYYSYTGNLAGSSSQPIWLDAVNCYSTYSCLAYCESCPSSQVSACTHSEDVALGCEYSSTDYTSSSPSTTLSTCQYADDSSDINISAIIGGAIAAFIICMLIIIAIPICICCCLGIGIGAAVRGSSRTTTTTVASGGSTGVTAVSASQAYNPAPGAFPASGYDTERKFDAPPQYTPVQGYAPQPGYPQQGYGYPPQ